MIVLIDDREKRPWNFPGVETETSHLTTGDYTVKATAEAGDYYSNIHPNALTGTTEKWQFKYGKLDFIWAGNRENAAQECLRLLDRWYLLAASDLF